MRIIVVLFLLQAVLLTGCADNALIKAGDDINVLKEKVCALL